MYSSIVSKIWQFIASLFFLPNDTSDNIPEEHLETGWGWFPALSVLVSIGLLLIAIANNASRDGEPWAWNMDLYWMRFLIIFVPVVFRLLSEKASRKERIALVLVVAVGLYIVKVLYSPVDFKFSDELQHWRSTFDIAQIESLFHPNPILPVSASYPGLESVVVAAIKVTGLSIFQAGILTIGVGRILFTLALYLLYERLSKSVRVASLAIQLYLINPHYLYFTSFYIYQSLALPFVALVLFSVANQESGGNQDRIGLKPVVMAGVVATTVTHHVTSYALLFFFLFWWVFTYILRFFRREERLPTWIVTFTVVILITWITYVAIITVSYLGPQIGQGIEELIRFVTREETVKSTFEAPDRNLIELIAGVSATLLISMTLPIGSLYVWYRYRKQTLTLLFAVGSFSYPATIILRLTSQGAEFAGRMWTFAFMMVVFTMAVGTFELLRVYPRIWIRYLFFPLFFSVIYLGGMISGYPPPWARMPGPFDASAGQRSIDRERIRAAQWAATLEHEGLLVTDFNNHVLMGSYGRLNASREFPELFFSHHLFSYEREMIQQNNIRYIVVDNVFLERAPVSGSYYASWETSVEERTVPIALDSFRKFDELEGLSRVFDSGGIVIYDTERILQNAP